MRSVHTNPQHVKPNNEVRRAFGKSVRKGRYRAGRMAPNDYTQMCLANNISRLGHRRIKCNISLDC